MPDQNELFRGEQGQKVGTTADRIVSVLVFVPFLCIMSIIAPPPYATPVKYIKQNGGMASRGNMHTVQLC